MRTLLRDLCKSFTDWSNNPAFIRRPASAPHYFLGPFVYYEQSRNQRFLVDGQQRFVTLHLIFLQLRVLAKGFGYDRGVDRLNRAITTDGNDFSIGTSRYHVAGCPTGDRVIEKCEWRHVTSTTGRCGVRGWLLHVVTLAMNAARFATVRWIFSSRVSVSWSRAPMPASFLPRTYSGQARSLHM